MRTTLTLSILFLMALPGPDLWAAPRDVVAVMRLQGMINPGSTEFLARAVEEAASIEAQCLIVELDTPGGLVTSLRSMVQTIMESKVPVVVYVWPKGAQAASAGALVTIAAHVAAMAPGTNIGAAHPVGPGLEDGNITTLGRKVENDLAALARSIASERNRNVQWSEDAVKKSASATAREAQKLNVIDLVAEDLDDLLIQLDGIEVEIGGTKRRLATSNAKRVVIKEGARERILRLLSDPNVAYILLMIGVTGLYFELAHPGALFPGVTGSICLLLGLYALNTLPVSLAGVLLLLLSFILFILELFITSHGILGLAGLISLVMGSIMLFELQAFGVPLDLKLVWGAAAVFGGFLLTVAYLAAKATVSRPKAGKESLEGEEGRAVTDIDREQGKVFVHGELWNATCEGHISEGKKVVVRRVKGMTVVVEPLEGGDP